MSGLTDRRLVGAASVSLVGGVALLRPDEQVFGAMLDGWRRQQLSRNLSFGTIGQREQLVRRFQAYTNDWPWAWSPVHLEEWMEDLRRGDGHARSTVRNYQLALKGFLAYVCDPVYGWAEECETRFGTHPVQICHALNTAAHLSDFEGRPARRALTRVELQSVFDLADEDVTAARSKGRKGWLGLFRDAVVFKCAYAWGLRRNEVRMLDLADFGANPHAAEFAGLGVCYVRHGKATKGSAPKRRSVLTVMPWSVDVMAEWIDEVRPLYGQGVSGSLWPAERASRIGEHALNARFASLRDRLELPTGVGLHALRHSYVTHLIEDGYDALFVQQQVGHEYASTTALYTSVSSDYRTRAVRAALDRIAATALEGGR